MSRTAEKTVTANDPQSFFPTSPVPALRRSASVDSLGISLSPLSQKSSILTSPLTPNGPVLNDVEPACTAVDEPVIMEPGAIEMQCDDSEEPLPVSWPLSKPGSDVVDRDLADSRIDDVDPAITTQHDLRQTPPMSPSSDSTSISLDLQPPATLLTSSLESDTAVIEVAVPTVTSCNNNLIGPTHSTTDTESTPTKSSPTNSSRLKSTGMVEKRGSPLEKDNSLPVPDPHMDVVIEREAHSDRPMDETLMGASDTSVAEDATMNKDDVVIDLSTPSGACGLATSMTSAVVDKTTVKDSRTTEERLDYLESLFLSVQKDMAKILDREQNLEGESQARQVENKNKRDGADLMSQMRTGHSVAAGMQTDPPNWIGEGDFGFRGSEKGSEPTPVQTNAPNTAKPDHFPAGPEGGPSTSLIRPSVDSSLPQDPRTVEIRDNLSLLVDNLVSAKMLAVMQSMVVATPLSTSHKSLIDLSTDPPIAVGSPRTLPQPSLSSSSPLPESTFLEELRLLREETLTREERDKYEMRSLRQLHSAEIEALRQRLAYLESQSRSLVGPRGTSPPPSSNHRHHAHLGPYSATFGPDDYDQRYGRKGNHVTPADPIISQSPSPFYAPSRPTPEGGHIFDQPGRAGIYGGSFNGVGVMHVMPTPTPSERSYTTSRHRPLNADEDFPLPIKSQRKQHNMAFQRMPPT